MEDLTGIDARDFRAAVGFPLVQVFANAAAYDIDVAAGLVWLVRRRTEPNLSYADVARTINFTTALDFDFGKGGDDDPEA